MSAKKGKSRNKRAVPRSDDDRKPVYVMISENARRILETAAKPPRTKATVIESLLENYENEDSVVKERILGRQNIRTLKEHGEQLELRSWAEHAFLNGRYVWAAEMYKKLANHPSTSEGLKNICNYRLSLCLIRLSYDIRAEALKEGIDKDTYHLALETLDEAIDYTRKVKDKIGPSLLFPELVLYYNLASCYSLKAQYMVESELDTDSSLTHRLRTARRNVLENVPEKEEVWKSIGEIWRSSQRERKIDKERNVDAEAEKALKELRQIVPSTAEGEVLSDPHSADLSDRVWLVDSTLTDEDFIFLRTDKHKFQPKFESWKDPALEDRQPTADAVRVLLHS